MVFSGSSCMPSLAQAPWYLVMAQMDSRTQHPPYPTLHTLSHPSPPMVALTR